MPRVFRPPRVAWVVAPGDGQARLRIEALNVPSLEWEPRRRAALALVAFLIRHRPEVLHLVLPAGELAIASIVGRLCGIAGIVATPVGPAQSRRYRSIHRLVLPSQAAARAWTAAGHPLGALVVVEPADASTAELEALRAVYLEVAEMTR